jgi:hypothetical protein
MLVSEESLQPYILSYFRILAVKMDSYHQIEGVYSFASESFVLKLDFLFEDSIE